MKAPQETTDKAHIGEVKELYPSCYDWQLIDFHAYWKVKMEEQPTYTIIWTQNDIDCNEK